METVCEYALSLKQPWAALVLTGLKIIEIRSWPTARRGRIFIHAARIIDNRSQGWNLVPANAQDLAKLTGGLIGTVDITDCLIYQTREEFERDCPLHRNDPAWFKGSPLYGFSLANPAQMPFRPFPGWFRFFKIPPA